MEPTEKKSGPKIERNGWKHWGSKPSPMTGFSAKGFLLGQPLFHLSFHETKQDGCLLQESNQASNCTFFPIQGLLKTEKV